MRHYPQRSTRAGGGPSSDMLCSRCIYNLITRYYVYLILWLLALSPFIIMSVNYNYRPQKIYAPKVPGEVPEPTIPTDDPELNIEWEDDMSDLENETWLHEQAEKTVKLPTLDDLIRYEEWSKTSTSIESPVTEEIEVIRPIPMKQTTSKKKGPPKLPKLAKKLKENEKEKKKKRKKDTR